MPSERRRTNRQSMHWEGLIVDLEGKPVGTCTMANVSTSGAKLTHAATITVPDAFVLMLTRKGEVRRHCKVTWREDASVGVRFTKPVRAEQPPVHHVLVPA